MNPPFPPGPELLDRRLLLAAALGVTTALLGLFTSAATLPSRIASSALPWEIGLAAGTLAALAWLRRTQHPWGRLLPLAGGTVAVATLAIAAAVGWWGRSAIHASGAWKWAPMMGGVTLVLWVLLELLERRSGERPAGTAALLGLLLATLTLQHGGDLPQTLQGGNLRTWNLFHYYLGSKYFEDVGYFGLYPAVLRGDELLGEGKRDFSHVDEVRDMRSYEIRPRKEVVAAWTADVPADHLRALARDARWLRGKSDSEWAARMFLDLGYNPAPPWTFLWGWLARVVPIDSDWRVLITGSDLLVHVLTIVALWWGFGPRTAAVAGVWIHSQPVNATLLLGGFLNYDWLLGTIVSVAALRRGRPGLSAFALALAAMTRGFPGLLALPILLRAGGSWLRRRPDPGRTRFALVFVGVCAVLFGLPHTTGRGLRTWPEWVEKISIHEDNHATSGDRRVGVAKMARHEVRPGRFFGQIDSRRPGAPATIDRRILVLRILGFGLLLPALWRRRDDDTMPLMLFAVFLLATSSRYYASVWAALFALSVGGGEGPWPRRIATVSLLWMVPSFAVVARGKGEYVYLSELAFVSFAAVCLAYVVGDWRAWRGLGKDESTLLSGNSGWPSQSGNQTEAKGEL